MHNPPRFRLGRLGRSILCAAPAAVGGQAVMEGVMMRSGAVRATAVRTRSGLIDVDRSDWFALIRASWAKKPFLRGFPVLLETLVNGIKALNWSAARLAEDEEDLELKPWHMVLTVVCALGLAMGLFVVAPHLMSFGLKQLGVTGDVDGVGFHAWDGFFKMLLFVGYIAAIGRIPDIRRVFEYHGAEHKVIHAYESQGWADAHSAQGFSRLHPRCGTTYMLFVLCIAVCLHALTSPLLLAVHTPASVISKHAYILGAKLVLMIPISAIAYEAIKFAGARQENPFWRLFSLPGMLLQRLTTLEPDLDQLETAKAALDAALEPAGPSA